MLAVPAEQTEGWTITRQRVAQAVHSVLGTAAAATHEALFLSVNLLDFAPIPGLQAAAKTLLDIWDAVQKVDSNRLSCLRLTERCADILLSVRQEVWEAGDKVTTELAPPIDQLTNSFEYVYTVLRRQANRPFIKRYLKRDEILRQINGCDAQLQQALGLFGTSVQIRIFKAVAASDLRRQQDTDLILDAINRLRVDSGLAPEPNALHLSGLPADGTARSVSAVPASTSGPVSPAASTSTIIPSLPVPFAPSPSTLSAAPQAPSTSTKPTPIIASPTLPPAIKSPSQILPLLDHIRTQQNAADASRDLADLRNIMRTALSKGSDADMLEVLGVSRDEMPEAIKTLQRALEKATQRDATPPNPAAASEVEPSHGLQNANGKGKLNKMVRRLSGVTPRNGKTKLSRSKTAASTMDGHSTGTSSTGENDAKPKAPKDTLDLEFMESGIDALRRMSKGPEQSLGLPSWTITRYEVDRDKKIGIGFFSDVYKGTWRGQTVAIKVLAESTPRNLFVREVEIWKSLSHPNVLRLFGASSTSSDPPWFFVCPYEKNGSLSDFLRRLIVPNDITPTTSVVDIRTRNASYPQIQPQNVTGLGLSGLLPMGRARSSSGAKRARSESGSAAMAPTREISKELDLLRYMHEIAKGMEYLHSKGVLHGDLKAANVLVSDRFHCIISDFGQSELKSEAYRISGTQPPHGTLRWQAPELMAGHGLLTNEMDVYAFAISCIEILSMGRMPWPLMDDAAVRHLVLDLDKRPDYPASPFLTGALTEVLELCWHKDPSKRPPFSKLVVELKRQREVLSGPSVEVTSPKPVEWKDLEEDSHSRPSPDMRPIPLPSTQKDNGLIASSPPSSVAESFTRTGQELSHSPPVHDPVPPPVPQFEDTVNDARIQFPEPVIYTKTKPSIDVESIFTSAPSESSHSEDTSSFSYAHSGYESPPPMDPRIADLQNERRYRLLLTHEYHPSLTLPLWAPSPVELGAVGYLSKPDGAFVTLLNAFSPQKSTHPILRTLPSVYGYGNVTLGSHRYDKRTNLQAVMDTVIGWITFRTMKADGQISKAVSRRYSYPLRTGHKAAYLCTEATTYRYIDGGEPPRAWFKAHVYDVLRAYGQQHHIQKENLYFVIGALDTSHYGQFVSHAHPDGQVHFNVYSSNKANQPWGAFTTDTNFPGDGDGPANWRDSYSSARIQSSKVSNHPPNGTPQDTVLLARLRFRPDVLDPTSM